MVKVDVGGQNYYLDGYLKSNLDIIIDQINNHDNDFVGTIDGFEGVGKSVLAQQVGKYVDPSLNMKRICFTSEEFKEAILTAKKGQCVIYDEAITGAFSREAIMMMNVILIKMMAQIRQKNLFILFVLPSFFDLDKNLAIWRSKFLIHCTYGKEYQRGFFKFANLSKKKDIYVKGSKLYHYPKSLHSWNFWGRFVKHYTVNEKIYKAKKLKSLNEEDYEKISLRKVRLQRNSFIIYLNNINYSQTDIAEVSDIFDDGLSQQLVAKILNKYRNNNNLLQNKTIVKLKSKYELVAEKKRKKNKKTIQKTKPHEHLNDDFIDNKKFNKYLTELKAK